MIQRNEYYIIKQKKTLFFGTQSTSYYSHKRLIAEASCRKPEGYAYLQQLRVLHCYWDSTARCTAIALWCAESRQSVPIAARCSLFRFSFVLSYFVTPLRNCNQRSCNRGFCALAALPLPSTFARCPRFSCRRLFALTCANDFLHTKNASV